MGPGYLCGHHDSASSPLKKAVSVEKGLKFPEIIRTFSAGKGFFNGLLVLAASFVEWYTGSFAQRDKK